MKKELKIFLTVTASAIVLFGSYSCSGDQKESDQQSERVTQVKTMVADSGRIVREINYTAHLEPFREVHLAPASPGRIDKILVEPGQRVTEGAVIAIMDQTQYNQAMLQLNNLEEDYRRLDTLRKVGSVSAQQFDQLATQYRLAKSNVQFLQENTRLRAPFTGVVSGKYFNNGEMFSGAPNTAAGKAAVISLIQSDRLKATVNIAERYYPFIHNGMDVRVSADVMPDKFFSGRVSAIYPQIDAATRTFKVEILIPNSQQLMRPGMFARALFNIGEENTVMVPALAVLKQQGSNERYLFLEKNGYAKRVSVQIGDRNDDMVEVISDTPIGGQHVIVAGHARIVDGSAVNIQK